MFKKVILISAMFAITTNMAFANGASFVPPPHCVGAFYVGIGISRDVAKFDTLGKDSVADFTTTTGIDPIILQTTLVQGSIPDNFRRDVDIHGNGIGGGILAGYSAVFNDQYTLAGEIFGDVSSADGKFHIHSAPTLPILVPTLALLPNFTTAPGLAVGLSSAIADGATKTKLNYTIGVSLLPGFKISHSTNFYGRIGWVYGQFSYRDNGAFQLVGGNVPQAQLLNANGLGFISGVMAGFPVNRNQSRSGAQVGFGFETMITGNIALRGEYDWERYGELAFRRANTGVVNINGVDLFGGPTLTTNNFTNIAVVNIKPTIDKFKLALIYHFNS